MPQHPPAVDLYQDSRRSSNAVRFHDSSVQDRHHQCAFPSLDLQVNVSQLAGLSSGAESVLALEHLRPQLTLLLQHLHLQARTQALQVAQGHQHHTQVRPSHQDPPRLIHTQAHPVALGHQAHTPVLQNRLDPLHPQAPIQVLLHLQTLILVLADQCHRLAHTAVPQFHPLTPVLLHPLPQPELCLLRAFHRRAAIRVRKDQWGRTLILIPMEPRSALPSPPDH